MDKNTLKTSFGKWILPINTKKLLKHVEESKQDYYTKKLTTEAYIKLMLLAQLQGFESLEAMSDTLVDDGLQKALGFDSINKSQVSKRTMKSTSYPFPFVLGTCISNKRNSF